MNIDETDLIRIHYDVQLRIDSIWRNQEDYPVYKPFLLPYCVTYPGKWLKYGKFGCGRIKPENWRRMSSTETEA